MRDLVVSARGLWLVGTRRAFQWRCRNAVGMRPVSVEPRHALPNRNLTSAMRRSFVSDYTEVSLAARVRCLRREGLCRLPCGARVGWFMPLGPEAEATAASPQPQAAEHKRRLFIRKLGSAFLLRQL